MIEAMITPASARPRPLMVPPLFLIWLSPTIDRISPTMVTRPHRMPTIEQMKPPIARPLVRGAITPPPAKAWFIGGGVVPAEPGAAESGEPQAAQAAAVSTFGAAQRGQNAMGPSSI